MTIVTSGLAMVPSIGSAKDAMWTSAGREKFRPEAGERAALLVLSMRYGCRVRVSVPGRATTGGGACRTPRMDRGCGHHARRLCAADLPPRLPQPERRRRAVHARSVAALVRAHVQP